MSATQKETSSQSIAAQQKYLTFRLGEEQLGVPILRVQEIISAAKTTFVPRSAGFMRGVMNLRGKILPVVDLRIKLGMDSKADDSFTCFIVVNAVLEEEEIAVGLVVDTVMDAVSFESLHLSDQTEDLPIPSKTIVGAGRVHDRVVFLFDVDALVRELAESSRGAISSRM